MMMMSCYLIGYGVLQLLQSNFYVALFDSGSEKTIFGISFVLNGTVRQGVINLDFMSLIQVKGLLKEKKLEMLVDPDLQKNYVEAEVEQLIQVALLCTQGNPMDRPKMSEVVRMLEGDGLAERWDEWQKVEVLRQEVELAPPPNSDWIVDSTENLHAVELSGPR